MGEHSESASWKQRADRILKALFGNLRTAIEADEREIEQALASRAATVLTSAIVLGIVIGWTLRKKP
jgi:F0F1-type ATP synthase assembly protein I